MITISYFPSQPIKQLHKYKYRIISEHEDNQEAGIAFHTTVWWDPTLTEICPCTVPMLFPQFPELSFCHKSNNSYFCAWYTGPYWVLCMRIAGNTWKMTKTKKHTWSMNASLIKTSTVCVSGLVFNTAITNWLDYKQKVLTKIKGNKWVL